MAHVVIADPDYSICQLLEQIVRLLGWTCDTAATGCDAWRLIENKKPDLVIAEVDLRWLSGPTLVRSMKLDPLLARTPVILLSSSHREDEAQSSGCTAFVAKPFYVDAFMQLVRSLAHSEKGD